MQPKARQGPMLIQCNKLLYSNCTKHSSALGLEGSGLGTQGSLDRLLLLNDEGAHDALADGTGGEHATVRAADSAAVGVQAGVDSRAHAGNLHRSWVSEIAAIRAVE